MAKMLFFLIFIAGCFFLLIFIITFSFFFFFFNLVGGGEKQEPTCFESFLNYIFVWGLFCRLRRWRYQKYTWDPWLNFLAKDVDRCLICKDLGMYKQGVTLTDELFVEHLIKQQERVNGIDKSQYYYCCLFLNCILCKCKTKMLWTH